MRPVSRTSVRPAKLRSMRCIIAYTSGKHESRGPLSGVPARVEGAKRLRAETKILNDLSVAVDVGALQVVQQAAALAHHLEQAAAAVMVLRVRAEVRRQVVDPLREDRDLHARRTRVGLVPTVLLECRCFFESHVVYSPRVQRARCAQSVQAHEFTGLADPCKGFWQCLSASWAPPSANSASTRSWGPAASPGSTRGGTRSSRSRSP